MIIKKRTLIASALFIFILIFTLFASARENKSVTTSEKISASKTIILDAGHGGFDGGAVANDGTVEKDINLEITLTLADFLRNDGYVVILTRETDTSTDDVKSDIISVRKKNDLRNRLELMHDYPEGIFISIHLNKFTTSAATGSQVFYSGKNEKSKHLGDSIQKNIISLLQPYNNRVNKKATSSTYILYNATIPAVLVECGFISNSDELTLLKNTDYQKKMAFCIYCGINEYLINNKEI